VLNSGSFTYAQKAGNDVGGDIFNHVIVIEF